MGALWGGGLLVVAIFAIFTAKHHSYSHNNKKS
jgi:hypothetical protein